MFCRAVKMHCMQETLHSMPACQIAESFCLAEIAVERVRYRHFRAVKTTQNLYGRCVVFDCAKM